MAHNKGMERTSGRSLGERIERAARKLRKAQDAEWITLTDLRAQLPNESPFAVDRTLVAMYRENKITLVQQADPRALTIANRMDGVTIGGRECHLIGLPAR
jgi:hypothetical protein